MRYQHPDLVDVLVLGLQLGDKYDVTIYEGRRTEAEQAQEVAEGDSATMNSRHIADANGICYAVDFAAWIDGRANWESKYYLPIANGYFRAAARLGVPLDWGGWWTRLILKGRVVKDFGHLALHKKFYPNHGPVSTHRSRAAAGVKWHVDPATGLYTHTTTGSRSVSVPS